MAETDFSNFLTNEDRFNLAFEDYAREFIERAMNDTLNADQSFIDRTLELMQLSESIGVDLEEKVKEYAVENGIS